LLFIGLIVVGVFMFKKYYATEKGRLSVDRFALKAPVFGPLIRKVAVARFSRTLGTMISSGVPIMDGLEIVAKTAGNKIIENAVFKVRQAISEGKTIAEPLSASGVFPPMVVQMISVGEATGAMDAMLNKIADFYDEEVDSAVSALTAMMEPMLMVFLGTTVGGLVIAMYLPIFKLAGTVGG
jgi:type IV pilus assembly protein PilC